MARALLFISLFAILPLAADCLSCQNRTASLTSHRPPNSCSPLPRLLTNGYTELVAEALYLRPTTCDLEYVIADPRQIPTPQTEVTAWLPQGKERPIDPDHGWGFRAGIGIVCSCHDLRAIYTRLRSNERAFTIPYNECGLWVLFAHPQMAQLSPVFNPVFGGNPTEGIVARATATTLVKFDAADVELGSRGVMTCELALRSTVGVHFAYIETTFADTWQGTAFQAFPDLFTEQVFNQSHRTTWGVGPFCGLDVHYPLACGFGFEAHVAGGLLVGNRRGTRQGCHLAFEIPDGQAPVMVTDQTLCVRFPSRSALVPFLDARLGLDYLWACRCYLSVQFSLGYEFHTYINAIEVFRFNDSRATGQSQCDSFSLNGLYLRARVVI